MVTDNNISWKIVTKENINIATEQLVDIDPRGPYLHNVNMLQVQKCYCQKRGGL